MHLKRLFDNAGLPTTKPRESELQEITKEAVGIYVLPLRAARHAPPRLDSTFVLAQVAPCCPAQSWGLPNRPPLHHKRPVDWNHAWLDSDSATFFVPAVVLFLNRRQCRLPHLERHKFVNVVTPNLRRLQFLRVNRSRAVAPRKISTTLAVGDFSPERTRISSNF